MPPVYDPAIQTPYNAVAGNVIPPDVYGVAINWFVNRTPLFSRLPKLPVGSDSYYLTNDNFRPRSMLLTGNYTTGTSTSLTVADSSSFDLGDVLQVTGEFFLVTSIVDSTHVGVTGAYAGSTGANHATGDTLYLITNARTGAEIDISGLSRVPVTVEQYNQTVMHRATVGGALAATPAYVSAYGSPVQRDKMLAMQNCVDDFEQGFLHGAGLKRSSASTKPMMKGLRTLMVTNRTTTPTNAGAYKPSDWIRDAIQPCYDAGGQPAVIFVSTNFLTGLSVWGNYSQRIDAGTNVFGTPIDLFEVSFLPGVMIIPHPLMRKFSSVTLSANECRLRMKRTLYEKPVGSRGDAEEYDYIGEGSIELDNESHHAWVEGMTAFSAT